MECNVIKVIDHLRNIVNNPVSEFSLLGKKYPSLMGRPVNILKASGTASKEKVNNDSYLMN